MFPKVIRIMTGSLFIFGGVLIAAFLYSISIRYIVSRAPEMPVSRQSFLRQPNPMTLPTRQDTEEAILEGIRKYNAQLPDTTEVSVVTAYFNLGVLKGKHDRTADDYYKWMSVFGFIDNPLIFFADTPETVDKIRRIRARYPPSRTTIFLVKREKLWAFGLADEILSIFQQPKYPPFSPNTVNPLYSCAMHAKFELVEKVVREHLYQRRYVAWLDIGLFRSEVKRNSTIHLTVPTDFNRAHVGYSQVRRFENLTIQEVIRRDKVWVGGASFLATPEVMLVYCREYRRAVRKMLDMKWMSTDQQVIYSMFEPSFNFRPRVQIQIYEGSWFGMGYFMNQAP